ncbi:MAG TPA: GNAT family N-acetyltransferase [Methylomirabilota bacterium]|nr:GNAT family N-acetyltransferase [Methylomirabilota bacterium]
MTYSIERVEWKDHGDVVSELLAGTFPGVPTTRYAWLHERNPAGPGGLWLARAADGRPVGTAALHARHVVVDGWTYLAGLATNFAVEPAARGFGPALALQRAVVAACEAGEFAFIYGFPNRAAKAVFERLGYVPGRTRRLARLLRSRPYLQRSARAASLAPVLARPVDLAMQLLSRETYRRLPRGARLERVEAFDASFDAFWARLRSDHAIVADRDAEYMNWRYAQWPTRRYDLTVLRRGAEVTATAVSYTIGDVVYVAELFALDPASFEGLLAPFLRAQRRAGACAVSLILLGDVDFAGRLARYGFRQRDVERSMMVYVPAGSPLRSRLHRTDRWTLFEGDIL